MKIIIIYLILLFFGFSLFADMPVTSFKALVCNKFINNLVEVKIEIKYDEDAESFYMAIPDEKFPMEITITDEYRDEMYKLIKRFERKYRNAMDWEEEYDLELGVLPTAESRFKRHNTWHNSQVNSSVNFFSQSTELHQLIIFYSPMPSRIDKDITRDGFKLYFWGDDFKELEKAFQSKVYNNFLKKLGE
ncbi:MAG: hypothetical protein K9M99_10780 [Candidatus Cloacimonetes bacterium]|nr:hypothetical protein [Candidatus Cloacimonadota bacterium]